LHAPVQAALYPLRGPFEGNRRVQADAVRACRLGEAVVGELSAPGKSDDGNVGMLHFQCCDDGGDWLDAPAFKEGIREYPGPAFEQLDCLRARLDLALQKLDDGGREHVDQGLESIGIAQGPLLDDGVL